MSLWVGFGGAVIADRRKFAYSASLASIVARVYGLTT